MFQMRGANAILKQSNELETDLPCAAVCVTQAFETKTKDLTKMKNFSTIVNIFITKKELFFMYKSQGKLNNFIPIELFT